MAGSLQEEVAAIVVVVRLQVLRVLAEVLLEEHLVEVIHLRQQQIQAVVLVQEVMALELREGLVMEVQVLFV